MLRPVRGSLVLIFSLVLLVHLTMMWLRLAQNFERPELSDERPLKVKLLKERKQIVQSEDSERKEKKDDAFLSDKDRSFDRQTKSRKVDTFKQAAKGGGAKGKPKKDVELSDLAAFAKGTDPFKQAAKEYSKQKKGDPSGDIQAEEQISSTNDHVEKVPLGDVTNLNTVEYKYYGFYHRIRQKLEQFWGRSIQEKAETLAREGRQLALSEEHLTSLQITLDSQGKIVSIRILGSSGVRELDSAAIESFNQAGPFPNPPKDLVKNGRVTLEWGFVVQT